MEENECRAVIFHHFRHKFYNQMAELSKDSAQKFKSVTFHLYHCVALLLGNQVSRCISEVETIRNEHDIKLAATIILIYAHKIQNMAKKSTFERLDLEMRELRRNADSTQFYHSAFVLLALEKVEKSLDYLENSLTLQPDFPEGTTLKAWILLDKCQLNPAEKLFGKVLKNDKKNLDACVGLSECLLRLRNPELALETINKAVVRFPNSFLPLLQKIRVYFAAQDWEHCLETLSRIPDRIESLKVLVLIDICRDCDYEAAVEKLQRLQVKIREKEPKNGVLLCENSQLFARISGGNAKILNIALELCEKAVETSAENVDFLTQLGWLHFMEKSFKNAENCFKSAVKIDAKCFDSLLGVTWCELEQNGVSDWLRTEIETLVEFEDAPRSPSCYLLRVKLAESSPEKLVFLKKASELLIAKSANSPYSDLYLLNLNPDLMMDIVREYLKFDSSASKPALELLKNVLCKALPGMKELLFLLAKLHYCNGDYSAAILNLEKILKVDYCADSLLLMARIQTEMGFFDRASQTLERGLSANLKIRENPQFFYIRGILDRKLGNLEESVKNLTVAVDLTSNGCLATGEKAQIYAELIRVRVEIGQIEQALHLVAVATEEFRGTAENGRMMILNAELAIVLRNVDEAVNILTEVTVDDKYYAEAQTKMADILLEFRKDRFEYIECFKKIVQVSPEPESYFLLGDAYKKLGQNEDAVGAYEKALEQNPIEARLNLKMGRLLVETGDHQRALDFFKNAIKTIQDPQLKLELARLHLELKQFEKAEELLLTELEEAEQSKSGGGDDDIEDLTFLTFKTQILTLLGLVRERSGGLDGALDAMKDAWDNQKRVRKRLMVEETNVAEIQLNILVQTSKKLADLCIKLKKNEQAVQYYKELLEILPENVEILVALAQLYMKMNSFDLCQQTCSKILQVEPENEQVSLLMADICFRKLDFDMAQFHFSQLLQKSTSTTNYSWSALTKLIEIARRTGNFDDIPEFLRKNAQNNSKKPTDRKNREIFDDLAAKNEEKNDPKKDNDDTNLAFCTGLYNKYTNNPNAALRCFNQSKRDPELQLHSLVEMIDICLNFAENSGDEQFFFDMDTSEFQDYRTVALKSAEKLLKELKEAVEVKVEFSGKYQLLKNFWLLQQGDKNDVEKGLEGFVTMTSQNIGDHQYGVILGLATGYTLLKQTQRARNQLKRTAKVDWTLEQADYLERCWLLLSEHYIQSAKFDVASDLLVRILHFNRSHAKAHELLGFISEKEQRLEDAVRSYENAWKYTGRMNADVGYKLAWSYMKCKEFADAIDVSHQVLKLKPDYPKIRKEVLDKSINNLRI